MSHYKHLTIEEREKLYLLRGQGKSIREIGRELNRSASTISRELKRGRSWRHPYTPSAAQFRYNQRRKRCGRKRILSNSQCRDQIRVYIVEQQWSPEQIANRLRIEKNPLQISYTSIYRAIHAGLFDPPGRQKDLRKKCRFTYKLRKKGKRQKKSGMKQRLGKYAEAYKLRDRPEEANMRACVGHWEADTVAGTKGKACLVTLTDRKSRYLLAAKAADKSSEAVKEKMIELLSALPPDAVKTVTPDRGSEFAQYEEVSAAVYNLTFYFPPPHSPWERGTNENTNGLIREYLPKHKDMTDASDEFIAAFVKSMNHRPRKCLGWQTPYEVFSGKVLHLT